METTTTTTTTSTTTSSNTTTDNNNNNNVNSTSPSSSILPVFKSVVLLKYILSMVHDIHQTLQVQSFKFKDLKSKDVSYHLIDFNYNGHNNNDENNTNNTNHNTNSNRGELLFQLKLEHDPNFVVYFKAMPIILRKCKNVLVLQRLHFLYPHYFKHLLRDECTKPMYNNKTLGNCTTSKSWVIDNIAASGSIPCLVYCIETIGIQPTPNTIDMACEHGRLPILHFLHENYPNLNCTEKAFELAAHNSHLDIIEFLLYNRTENYTLGALVNAASTNNVDMERLLLEHRKDRFQGHTEEQLKESILVDISVKSGSLDMVQLLFEHFGRRGLTTRALDNAAELGHLDIVTYLDQTAGAPATQAALTFAAKNGHYDVVRYLHENRVEGSSEYAMNMAASGGYLEIVQYLHVNGKKATKDAMHYAVISGRLEIVKFLHQNRTEGCNGVQTLLQACLNGTGDYVETIKYILENRLATYIRKSPINDIHSSSFKRIMQYACSRNNLELYTYLVDYFSLGYGLEPTPTHPYWDNFRSTFDLSTKMWIIKQFDPSTIPMDIYRTFILHSNVKGGEEILQYVMDHNPKSFEQHHWYEFIRSAAQNENIGILQFFHQHSIENSFSQNLMNQCCESGSFQAIKFLHENRTEGCSTLAMDNAGSKGHLELVQWLLENRTEGSTKSIMKSTISNNHYEVFQYLVNNNIYLEQSDLVDCAAASRSVHILQYICENLEKFSTPLLPSGYAFARYHELIFRLLVYYFPIDHIRGIKYIPTNHQPHVERLCHEKETGTLDLNSDWDPKKIEQYLINYNNNKKGGTNTPTTTNPQPTNSIFKKLFSK